MLRAPHRLPPISRLFVLPGSTEIVRSYWLWPWPMSRFMQSAPVAPGVGLVGAKVWAVLIAAFHDVPPLVVLRMPIVCAPFWSAPIPYTVVDARVEPTTAVRLMRPMSVATGAGG